MQRHHRVTGSLRAVARGDVAALEEGRVVEVTVREGASVRKGDVIARGDTRRLEAQKSELQATLQKIEALVAQHQAELRQAKLDLDRHRKLVQSNASTMEEFEHRETAVVVAQAQLESEQRRSGEINSQIELLQIRLDDMTVRAPYNGRIVERHTEPGEWIRAGAPFVTMVSSGQVEAWLEVPERFLHGLVAGDTSEASSLQVDVAELSVNVRGSDRSYPVLSAKRVPDVQARARTFPLVLTLDDANGALTPGMSVDAWIPVGSREPVLTVPKDAVIRSGRTEYVFKATEMDGTVTAVQAPVSVQFETGSLAVIVAENLADGDRVVVEGNERLTSGAPIMVVDSMSTSRRKP
ncbi:Multidrug resistance protein MdtA precursor [Maioricimonas rarisocia]|uniref:Multidrug resistance protein MdtA n=2 Tax=Maioricimonas rarisocia TaxID=2528026 RepID=A0A517ZAQ2_9PLAN|nr:Multidrug resistance protein MdtA precursor [Maioricimonas rarisocia]